MSRLGTWTTYDSPTENKAEALKWLEKEFKKIGGLVWKKTNPHEFGSYPSFEIDQPEEFDGLDKDDDSEDGLDLLGAFEDWQDKANEVEDRYSEKFGDYL